MLKMFQHNNLRKEKNKLVDIVLLNEEIKEIGIPYSTLAEKCGVSRQTLSNWLNNPRLISAEHAKILADALRITEPDKLLRIFFASDVEKSST